MFLLVFSNIATTVLHADMKGYPCNDLFCRCKIAQFVVLEEATTVLPSLEDIRVGKVVLKM